MNLLLATLAAPLATAAVGAIPGPRRPKEAVFLGGLTVAFDERLGRHPRTASTSRARSRRQSSEIGAGRTEEG